MTKSGKDVHDPDLQSDFQDDMLEAEMNNSDADKRDDSAIKTHSRRVSQKPRCLGDWAILSWHMCTTKYRGSTRNTRSYALETSCR